MRSIKLHILVTQDIGKQLLQPGNNIFDRRWTRTLLSIFLSVWNGNRWRLNIKTQLVCCILFQSRNGNGKWFPWILLQGHQWLWDNMILSWLWWINCQNQHTLYQSNLHIKQTLLHRFLWKRFSNCMDFQRQ